MARFLVAKLLGYSAIAAGITLFYFLLPYIGSGPIFKREVYRVVDNCETNWWPNLVAIGNWWSPMEETVCFRLVRRAENRSDDRVS